MDPALYGTATDEEIKQLEDCVESATGVKRLADKTDGPTYEDLYAERLCAERLGIASKVIRLNGSDGSESAPTAQDVEALNSRTAADAECLEQLGWEVEALPPDKEGVVGFRALELNDTNETRFEIDLDQCVSRRHGHSHSENETTQDH